MKTKNPRAAVLGCFFMAGLWATSLVTYAIVSKDTPVVQTADVHVTDVQDTAFSEDAARRRLFNRGQEGPRTTPFAEETAPNLNPDPTLEDIIGPPIPEGEDYKFKFPEPKTADPVVPVAPVAPVAPVPDDSVSGQLGGVIAAITSLINGNGDIGDIVKIGTVLMALFGGFNIGSSDGFLKIILSIFSKKSNFNAILEEKLDRGTRRSRRRSRK